MTDRTYPTQEGRVPEGVEWNFPNRDEDELAETHVDSQSRANINSLALSLSGALEDIEKLKAAVSKLVSDGMMPGGKPALTVRLYCIQHGYTSAPSEGSRIGKKGQVGANYPSLSLHDGEYPILETYEIDTEDFGVVRWVQIRCGENDPTRTNDWFAYIPVRPDLVDTEHLYNQLFDADSMTMLDDITMKSWGQIGFRSFMAKRALSKDVPNGTSSPRRNEAPRFA